MLKNKFLGAAAAFAFVATGVVAHAQDNKTQDEKRQEAPGAEHRPMAAPRADNGGAMQRKDATKAAEGERRDQDAARKDATRADAPNDAQPKAADADKRAAPDAMRHADKDAMRPGDKDAMRPGDKDAMRPRDKDAMRDGAEARGEPRVNGVKIEREHAIRIGEELRRGERFQRPDFDVRVGVRVPESYGLRPLPPEIIALEPQYRGYDYFLDANDEVVFVSPETHEIVGTIDYDQRAAAVDSPRRARPCPPEE